MDPANFVKFTQLYGLLIPGDQAKKLMSSDSGATWEMLTFMYVNISYNNPSCNWKHEYSVCNEL